MIAVSWGRPSMRGTPFKTTREQIFPSIDAIVVTVCAQRGVSIKDVYSRRRDHKTAHVRQECYYRARHETGFSLPQIARHFGKDHTTIMFGVRKHIERMSIRCASAPGFQTAPDNPVIHRL